MIVLDCSAAIHIVRDTPEGRALMQLLLEGEEIAAPDLFSSEIASAVSKYIRFADVPEKMGYAWCKFAFSLVDTIVPSSDLMLEAISESVRLEHSVYDMFYFVLARRNAATLFTLDRDLQELCTAHGVNCVSLVNL